LKPTFASWRIIAARVKASARKMICGYSARSSAMSHSQNASGLVCGLSTRKISTPWLAQKRTVSRSASHRARQSSVSQLTL